jgi:hypothetical protein
MKVSYRTWDRRCKIGAGMLTGCCQREGWERLVCIVTSKEPDFLVTTRAVPATYEPKDRHNKECRRLQVADSLEGEWKVGISLVRED